MDNLEKLITDHRELFDDKEPAAGHFARFEDRLRMENRQIERHTGRRMFLRIAAVALLLVTVGLIVFDLATGNWRNSDDAEFASVILPADIRDAYEFYEQRSLERLGEINRLTEDCPRGVVLRDKANKEVSAFEANTQELKRALTENPDNERIQAALIQNQKLKEAALNNILLEGNMDNCRKR